MSEKDSKENKAEERKIFLRLYLPIAAAIVLYFFLLRYKEIIGAARYLLGSLRPVFIGAALAYVLFPVQLRLEKALRNGRMPKEFSRALSVALTMLICIAVIMTFFGVVLPDLTQSVMKMIDEVPPKAEALADRISRWLEGNSDYAGELERLVNDTTDRLEDWLKNNLANTISGLALGIKSVGAALINTIISLIVAIYLLLGRERYMAHYRKLFAATVTGGRWSKILFDALTHTDRIFRGFITGKLTDSLIVGIICMIALSVMKMPYALLISVIVGVTNIIPMFGPFIGAIPSAFLLLLVDPGQCLAFLIFIIILQQIDGNIIGPRILGNSTGLSALYVLTAMLIFGKLMGFFGMIVGVPLFATLYYIIKTYAEASLAKRGLPVDTAEYVPEEEESRDEPQLPLDEIPQ